MSAEMTPPASDLMADRVRVPRDLLHEIIDCASRYDWKMTDALLDEATALLAMGCCPIGSIPHEHNEPDQILTRDDESVTLTVHPRLGTAREKSAHPLDLSSHVDQLGNIEVFVEVGAKRSPDGTTRRAVLSANDSPARTAGWLRELADDIAAAGKDAR